MLSKLKRSEDLRHAGPIWSHQQLSDGGRTEGKIYIAVLFSYS